MGGSITPSDGPAPDVLEHPLLQWLLYGHVWVALAVVAQIGWTGFFLHDASLVGRYAAAAALGTFAAYGVMRLARAESPEHTHYANLAWYARNLRLLKVLVGASSVVAFILMWPMWRLVWSWLVPAMVLAFFYVTPFTTRKGRGIGLRDIPFLKAFLIAALWCIVTVAIPLKLDPYGHSLATIAAMTCMRIPLILALAIAFDIRDRNTDPIGLRTMPQVLGTGGAKATAIFFLLCSAVFEVIFLWRTGYTSACWTMLVGYVVAVVLVAMAKPVRDAIYYGLLIDGVMILIPLCVWIGR